MKLNYQDNIECVTQVFDFIIAELQEDNAGEGWEVLQLCDYIVALKNRFINECMVDDSDKQAGYFAKDEDNENDL